MSKYSHAAALALQAAKLSPCKKRKVGAVIITDQGKEYTGWNCNGTSSCEGADGNTLPSTVHAEMAAIDQWRRFNTGDAPESIYVTHPPCANCAAAIEKLGIKEVIIVSDFMKFDSGKATFDLLPRSICQVVQETTSLTNFVIDSRTASACAYPMQNSMILLIRLLTGGRSAPVVTNAINKVLQYGAKKYKPNNWRNADNVDRYWDALMRHCQAIELGEVNDQESGLPHADHALCNIAFLIELTS